MNLEIITPEKKLFAGEAEIIKLPGALGSFEILKNHAPMISTLLEGKIKVKDAKGTILSFEINGGIVEVLNNKVIVLVDTIIAV
jgi:F-type H+-transporting ATPase subunit epsilon